MPDFPIPTILKRLLPREREGGGKKRMKKEADLKSHSQVISFTLGSSLTPAMPRFWRDADYTKSKGGRKRDF